MPMMIDKDKLLKAIQAVQSAFKTGFPKRSFKLNDAINLIKDFPAVDTVDVGLYEQVKFERDYLQGFVDEQIKVARKYENYEDKCDYHCFKDLCDFTDKCDACKKSYEHGIGVREGAARAYALVFNAEHLRDLTKVVKCKDCKNLAYWDDCVPYCPVMDISVNPDDYCSHGERKEK